MIEIPEFCLRAYALFFSTYGTQRQFQQSALDWIVSQSMKKKIFAILVRAGWLEKKARSRDICKNPEIIMNQMLDLKVLDCMKQAQKKYAFTRASAVEVWSDYSYVQRSREKSPYFILIEEKEKKYWKVFFSKHGIYYYFEKGATIGEYVVLIPLKKVDGVEKNGVFVEPINKVMNYAKENEMFEYAYLYMKEKYGEAS